MCTTEHDNIHTLMEVFLEQSCAYLVEILLLAPNAQFVCKPDPPQQSTFFTRSWLDLGLLLVLAVSRLVC